MKNKSVKIRVDNNIFSVGEVNKFKSELVNSGKMISGSTYSILLKARQGEQYVMLANKQSGYLFNPEDYDSFEKLFMDVTDYLNKIFEDYNHILRLVVMLFYGIFEKLVWIKMLEKFLILTV